MTKGRRRLPKVVLALCTAPALTLTLVATTTATAAAQDTNPEILSNYENSNSGYSIDRDCGYSTPEPSKSGYDLWLFCDSIIYDQTTETQAILGTDTAAEGPYTAGEAPTSLSELPTPPAKPTIPNDNAPSPFMPLPTGLVNPNNGDACTGSNDGVYPPSFSGPYPASWFTGMAQEPSSSTILITFSLYCVVPGATNPFPDEGWGVVQYTPSTNTLGTPTYVFTTTGGAELPTQEQLGNPIFYDGYLYLFEGNCTSSYDAVCIAGDVYLARVTASSSDWTKASDYQFWDGSGWSSSYSSAASVISGVTPFGISVANYSNVGHGFVLISDVEEWSNSGELEIYTASSPTSWTELETDDNVLSNTCTDGTYGCYAINGHPELSTTKDLVFSYYDPGGGSNGLGHLYIDSYPW
jgi:hypothetical protein